jgi:chromosome segregation ATPase
VLDGDTVDALDNLGDTWDALKVAGQAVIAKVLVPFAPLLTDIASAALKADRADRGSEQAASRAGARHHSGADPNQRARHQVRRVGQRRRRLQQEDRELIDNGVSLQVASHQIAQEIVGVGTAAAKSTGGIGKLGEGFKGAGKDADKAADEIKKLMDEITGADSIASLRALEKAWNALTPAEQKNAIALGVVQQKFVDLASKLPKLPDDLRNFAVAMNDAAEKAGLLTLKIGELKPLVDALGPTTDKSAKAFKDWGFEVGFEATIPIINLGKALKETGGYIDRLPESIDKATNETKDWEKALGDLSQALANLAQISDGTFGKVARGLASIVGAATPA